MTDIQPAADAPAASSQTLEAQQKKQQQEMMLDEDPLLISQTLTYVTDDGSVLHSFQSAAFSFGTESIGCLCSHMAVGLAQHGYYFLSCVAFGRIQAKIHYTRNNICPPVDSSRSHWSSRHSCCRISRQSTRLGLVLVQLGAICRCY